VAALPAKRPSSKATFYFVKTRSSHLARTVTPSNSLAFCLYALSFILSPVSSSHNVGQAHRAERPVVPGYLEILQPSQAGGHWHRHVTRDLVGRQRRGATPERGGDFTRRRRSLGAPWRFRSAPCGRKGGGSERTLLIIRGGAMLAPARAASHPLQDPKSPFEKQKSLWSKVRSQARRTLRYQPKANRRSEMRFDTVGAYAHIHPAF
jgi:hypothetical protein